MKHPLGIVVPAVGAEECRADHRVAAGAGRACDLEPHRLGSRHGRNVAGLVVDLHREAYETVWTWPETDWLEHGARTDRAAAARLGSYDSE